MNTRKPNRIPGWDYSSAGCYFITVCTDRRKPILSSILSVQETGSTGENVIHRQTEYENILYQTILTPIGQKTEEAIRRIPRLYPGATVEHYVIMPNHIHLLIGLEEDVEKGPSLSHIINQMKGFVRKSFPHPVWQKGFYDHVVRSEQDYWVKYKYIDRNPLIWLLREDEYYYGD